MMAGTYLICLIKIDSREYIAGSYGVYKHRSRPADRSLPRPAFGAAGRKNALLGEYSLDQDQSLRYVPLCDLKSNVVYAACYGDSLFIDGSPRGFISTGAEQLIR
jgi:hypothetical protein